MNSHAFFLAVGWSSAALLLVEILVLWRRSRRGPQHLTPRRRSEEESS